jgi:glycosyltransferase involved in cell wall biosynthesis
MKIYIVSRRGFWKKWGGDTKVLAALCRGLKKLGHRADLVADPLKIGKYDYIFLSNTSFDLRPIYHFLKIRGSRYGLIGFHENKILHAGASSGFYRYVRGCLDEESDELYPFDVDRLLENPELIFYYAEPPRKMPFLNYDILKNAELAIASCASEAKTMQRDCNTCDPKVVHWPPGFVEENEVPTDAFLKLTGLKSKEYILQVGRFEKRKNQLASILATKDLDIPLVFIATMTVTPDYEKTALETIYKYRKAPTFVLSQLIPSMRAGNLHILQMPKAKKLSTEILLSAYQHAGLHLHPAFYELPGLTYFESAKLGIPTIASSWATIPDYFKDASGAYTLDDRIEYVLPYHLPNITALVKKKFGQKYPISDHPTFHRTSEDTARELLTHMH